MNLAYIRPASAYLPRSAEGLPGAPCLGAGLAVSPLYTGHAAKEPLGRHCKTTELVPRRVLICSTGVYPKSNSLF